jgi:hypothetical protein
MWKIAIAVMLLATTAFGAASLTVSPQSQATDKGATIQLTFTLVNPEGLAVVGYDIGSMDVTPSGRTWLKTPTTGVRVIDPVILAHFGQTTADSTLANKTLAALGDLGATSNDSVVADNDLVAPQQPLETVNFIVQAAAVFPFTVRFTGTVVNRTGIDDVFGDGSLLVPITNATAWSQDVTLTPEPASMLLLAAGSLLFARRRRVA